METNSTDSQWAECSGGELEQVIQTLKTRRQQRARVRLASVVAALVLVSAGLFAGRHFWGAQEPAFGNITCRTVKDNLEAYVAGEVDSKLAAKMRQHLDDCPHCKGHHKRMLEKSSSDSGSGSWDELAWTAR